MEKERNKTILKLVNLHATLGFEVGCVPAGGDG